MTKSVLIESCNDSMQLALSHCADSCRDYHWAWPALRLAGIVFEPEINGKFYRTELKKILARQPTASILISGTADYAMLETIYPVVKDSKARITVIDFCDTPLKICKWYADKMNMPIDVKAADIFDHNLPPNIFDVIVTDSFYNQFPHEQRPALFASWANLLCSGGSIITASAAGYDQIDARQIELTAMACATLARRKYIQIFGGIKYDIGLPKIVRALRRQFDKILQTNKLVSCADFVSMMDHCGLEPMRMEWGVRARFSTNLIVACRKQK